MSLTKGASVIVEFLMGLTCLVNTPSEPCVSIASVGPYPARSVEAKSIFDNGYKEERFHKVLDVIQDTYGPLVKNEGGELHLLIDWSDGAVNMWAFRYGDEYWLEIPGGMARYHLIIEEAFLTSLCHELGHLLGGAPRNGQISYEGQADYYATRVCIRKLLKALAPDKDVEIDSDVELACASATEKTPFCERAMQGAKSLSSYYAELEKSPFPQITSPSQANASETFSQHPPAQCRLDTFVAGYFDRPRPRCWYHSNP